MKPVSPSLKQVASALAQPLYNLPGYVVAIDGKDGAGKTTLGRFLAWHFNIALIETDLFMMQGNWPPRYYDDHILRIIKKRLAIPRPVIVEGIRIIDRLNMISVQHDFLVYLRRSDYSSSEEMEALLAEYEVRAQPESCANMVLELEN